MEKTVLSNPYSMVVINNAAEYAYHKKWSILNGKKPLSRLPVDDFPLYLSTAGGITGWTDRMDRNLNYISFLDFVTLLGEY